MLSQLQRYNRWLAETGRQLYQLDTDAWTVYDVENGVWDWDAIWRLLESYRVRRR